MPMTGVEPVRCHHRQILSLVRLPIPPHRLVETNEDYYITALIFCQDNFIKNCIVFYSVLTSAQTARKAVQYFNIIIKTT